MHVWDLENHESVAVLRGHPKACNVVKFNPRLAMMASACSELVRGRGGGGLKRDAAAALTPATSACCRVCVHPQAFWLPSDADGPLYGEDLERRANA